MAQLIRTLIVVLGLAFALVAPAAAQEFPPLTGRVVDQANLLDPAQEAALTAKLEALEQQSQRQLVVATIPDLQGYDIADYGYQLGRAWGLGGEERNDGALLIVAPNERKVRIEVGYGLEGIVTDALSSVIINSAIVPRFRADDYARGIAAGVDQLVAQLQLPEEEARAIAAQAQQAQQPVASGGGFGFGNLIFLLFVFFFFILPMLRGGRRGRRYRGGGIGNVILWSALGSMASGGRGGGFGGGGFGGGGFGGGGGGFSGGGGSFGGGGASGSW